MTQVVAILLFIAITIVFALLIEKLVNNYLVRIDLITLIRMKDFYREQKITSLSYLAKFSLKNTLPIIFFDITMSKVKKNLIYLSSYYFISCVVIVGIILTSQNNVFHYINFLFLIFSLIIVVLGYIDLATLLLPDIMTLGLLWLGLLHNLFDLFCSLSSALIGCMVGYGMLWIITRLFYLLTGKVGMGDGDLKLFSGLGAWWGVENLPIILLIATSLSMIAIVLKKTLGQSFNKQLLTPFGPYLAFAGWLVGLKHLYG